MSDPSDSGHVPTETSSSMTFPFAHVATPDDGPQTVINEGRQALMSQPAPVPTGSTVWNRLFAIDPPSSPILATDGDPAGIELGHFVIEERIGVGGMGAVFRARDTRLQRDVALKVLSPSQSVDQAAVQRFQNEARAAARLNHENVARVFYIGEDQGLHFIAFEYVIGTNIRDLIRHRGGRLTPADAINYTLQIASALNHTSAAGVVHRDIKPSNVIVTPTDRAKLVDLGLARKENTESADLTVAGTTLGTFDYISPEQAKDPRSVDVRSDIYSLGCTLYHMLTGEPPYPEGTVLQKLLDHQGKELPNPALKNREVSPDLAAIVQKMMAADPDRRYANPDQLIRDLMVVAGTMGLRSVNPEGLVWMTSRPAPAAFWERNLSWITTAAVLLLIVFLLPRFQDVLEWNNPPEQVADATAGTDGIDSALIAGTGDGTTNEETVVEPVSSFEDVHPESTADEPTPPTTTTVQPTAVAANDTAPSDAPPEPAVPTPLPGPANTNETPTVASADTPTVQPEIGVDRTPFAVIGTKDSTPLEFPTLEAACAVADDGSVIELRFNGPRTTTEKPIRITKKRLIIRPAKGYKPILRFQPKEVDGEGWQTRMITLSEGSLDMVRVGVELTVPDEIVNPNDDGPIALFSMNDSALFRIENVNITVRNPSMHMTAVVELRDAPVTGIDNMPMLNNGMMPEPTELEIEECFVRGNADLILAHHSKPARYKIQESVVALWGALLHNRGTRQELPERQRDELRLNHVTALLAEPLIKVDTGNLPRHVVPVHVMARDNIFAVKSPLPQPLIAMTGTTNLQDFRSLLVWREGNCNYYDRLPLFWKIESSSGDGKPVELSFEDWKTHWSADEVSAQNLEIGWMRNWRILPFEDLSAEEVALDRELPDNAPLSGATDGSDAGAFVEHLGFPRHDGLE